MAISPSEFERQLQPLLEGWDVGRLPSGWRLADETRVVQIQLTQLPLRRIGLLELPCLGVKIDFEKCSREDEARFLLRFQRYFQRGGG